MFRILLTLLLIYFAANLLLAITMMFVSFIESIVRIADTSDRNIKREPISSTLEISSFAFGISLVVAVVVSAFLFNSIRSIEDLGHIVVAIMIVVQLITTLLFLISKSNNKVLTTIVSIAIFLCCRYVLIYFDLWLSIPIPYFGMFVSVFRQIPLIGQSLDTSVVLFLLLLIPVIFMSSKNTART